MWQIRCQFKNPFDIRAGMPMIDLYGCGSPNVLKILLALEELELPYRFNKVDVFREQQYAPAFLAISPNNKVPAIIDHDGPDGRELSLFESGAILFYLAEKTGKLLPRSLAARSEVMQWLMFQMAGVGPMFGQALHFQYIAPKNSEYARHRYLSEVKRLYGVIETRLTQSAWMGGNDYSIADIAIYPWAGKYRNYPGFDATAAHYPHLARWIAAVEARPASLKTNEFYSRLFKEGLRDKDSSDPRSLDRFFGRKKFLCDATFKSNEIS
jgi:GST-like protein